MDDEKFALVADAFFDDVRRGIEDFIALFLSALVEGDDSTRLPECFDRMAAILDTTDKQFSRETITEVFRFAMYLTAEYEATVMDGATHYSDTFPSRFTLNETNEHIDSLGEVAGYYLPHPEWRSD